MATTRPDFVDLLERAQAGDREARQELVTRFYPRVRAQVHRSLERDVRRRNDWVGPLFSTSDVVQEVFVSILRTLPDFGGGDSETFVQYLASAVHHRLIDAVRYHRAGLRDARRVGQRLDANLVSDGPTPLTEACFAELVAGYDRILAGFSERDRRLLALRLHERRRFEHVARVLGFPSADAARKAFGKVQALVLARLGLGRT